MSEPMAALDVEVHDEFDIQLDRQVITARVIRVQTQLGDTPRDGDAALTNRDASTPEATEEDETELMAPERDDLGAAWAEAEAALPKGWMVSLAGHWEDGWQADVESWPIGGDGITITTRDRAREWMSDSPTAHPNPASALRALAARLREVER